MGTLTDWVVKAYDSDGVGKESKKPFVLIHLAGAGPRKAESTGERKTTFWVRLCQEIDRRRDFSYNETYKK